MKNKMFERIKAIIFIILWIKTVGEYYMWEDYCEGVEWKK